LVAVLNIPLLGENSPPGTETPPDVVYTNIVVAEVPWSIQVVTLPRGNHRYEIQARHAGGGALGMATLSDQAAAAGTERSEAVAAINGGFFLRDNGRTNVYAGCPRGVQIVDGRVLSAPSGNACLWLDYLGEPQVEPVASRFAITWPDGRQTPFGLNGPRTEGEVELYTPAAGASTHTTGGRELVLERWAGGAWLPLRLERDYRARLREIRPAGDTPLAADTMVLSLAPALALQFQGLAPGAVLRISTRSRPALFTAKTALSAGPLLVRNGRSQKISAAPDDAYEFSSMLERHPRSAFGWNDRSFFLVQVDGRQKDLSLGMTLDELSAFLVKLGCREAINLDGGGSSSLWFEGRVRNNPCDGYERTIANSLVVLRKKAHPGGKIAPSTPPESRPAESGPHGP
jgi:hypothetical protein